MAKSADSEHHARTHKRAGSDLRHDVQQIYTYIYVYIYLYHSAWVFERYRHSVQMPCTLSSAFEARVYQYTIGYIRAPWQLRCPFPNCEHIIDKFNSFAARALVTGQAERG